MLSSPRTALPAHSIPIYASRSLVVPKANLASVCLEEEDEVAVVLRSLDAIHLAAAQRAGAELRAVITYDARISDAARALAIPVVGPS